MVPLKCNLNSWFDCLLHLVCNNEDSLCTKCWKQWCKVPASCPWAILCYTWQRSIGCWRKHADSCGFQSSSNRRSCQSHDTSLWNWWVNVVLYLDGHAGVCRCGFQMLFHSFLTCRQEAWLTLSFFTVVYKLLVLLTYSGLVSLKQGWCKMWIQIGKFNKQIQLKFFCLQFDDLIP